MEAVRSRVAELNPYVQVSVSTDVVDDTTDLSFLKRYQVCLHLEHKKKFIIFIFLVSCLVNEDDSGCSYRTWHVYLFILVVCSINRNEAELAETDQ